MVHIVSKAFATLAEAEEWRDQCLVDYHPAGYGTLLTVHDDGGYPDPYYVTGTRGSSAD